MSEITKNALYGALVPAAYLVLFAMVDGIRLWAAWASMKRAEFARRQEESREVPGTHSWSE